jgi:hypothetical protein
MVTTVVTVMEQPAGSVVTIELLPPLMVFTDTGEAQAPPPVNPVASVTAGDAAIAAAAVGITVVIVSVAGSAATEVKPTVHVVTAPVAAEVGATVTAVGAAAPANEAVPSRAREVTMAMATNLVTSLMGLRRDIVPCPVVE